VVVEWKDRIFDVRAAELQPNQGVFVLTLHWGRAVEFHVYCDTQGLARNLEVIAAQGASAALSAPLQEPSPS
jgi:hypothetical protein